MIIDYIAEVPIRVSALGKYLVALSSITLKGHRKLHILYDLNDILYHVIFKIGSPIFKDSIQPFLPDLVLNAWESVNYRNRLDKLIRIWIDKNYYTQSFLQSLNDKSTITHLKGVQNEATKQPAEPTYLGIYGSKYHDLPVSSMCCSMQGAISIDIESVQPIRLSKTNVQEVTNQVDRFYGIMTQTQGLEGKKQYSAAPDVMTTYEGWTMDFFERHRVEQA